MSKLTRENAILPSATSASLKDKIGCAVVYKNHPTLGTEAELWNPNDHQHPNAVLLYADEESASLAMLFGGLAGTVKVKLTEQIWRGGRIYAVNDGINVGFGNHEADPPSGSGTYYICGMALEDGVAGEMVEAVLFKPEPFTID